MFFLYTYTVFYHDKANKLVIAKYVLSLCMKKRSNKNLPWLQYSTRQ